MRPILLCLLFAACTPPKSGDTLGDSIRQYNDGKLQEALESFDRVVKENPSLAEAYYYRGLCSLGLSKIDAAKADFKKLLELEPNSSHAADAREFLKSL